MEITIGETSLKVYKNGDIFKIDKRCPNKGYVKCESTPNNDGYLQIRIDNKKPTYHRVIAHTFLGIDLFDSNIIIDHIDRNKLNNNISNLHIVSKQSNCFNTDAKNYTYIKKHNRWLVHFIIDGKSFHLGYFKTEDEAIEKAKDVSKYQIIGDKFIKAEDVIIPKKDLKPNIFGKYVVEKKINKKRYYVGTFNTSAEARQARLDFIPPI
jgi:hypothetical protein